MDEKQPNRASKRNHVRQPTRRATSRARSDPAPLIAAYRSGDITIESDDTDRRATVTWNDPDLGDPIIGAAIARPGYGGILLGQSADEVIE